MSIYLLDADILSVDLNKDVILNSFEYNDRIKIVELRNNGIYYENGLPKLNLEYIQWFKNNNSKLFDTIIRKTNTRIV